jgi:hypothetical protein
MGVHVAYVPLGLNSQRTSRTLGLLMSRCTTPASCIAAMPRAMSRVSDGTSTGSRLPSACLRRRYDSRLQSHTSITCDSPHKPTVSSSQWSERSSFEQHATPLRPFLACERRKGARGGVCVSE